FIKNKKLYKTGDLARWLSDGNIEFLGRIDHQVKIRGFRVELGEIEAQLLKKKEIKEAVVLAKQDESGDKNLYAYIVLEKEIEVSELREYLSNYLPDYMIPSFFIKIESIPLNPNGKVDRNALPDTEVTVDGEYIAPRNEVEEKLVEIWSEVLNMKKDIISIDSNFFELGGHSLKATTLASIIHKEFDVKIPLTEVFINPTIRELSQIINRLIKDKFASIEPVEKKEYYELSAAQNRLWILDQIEKDLVAYNMPGSFELEKLNREAFEKTIETLIKRHEILRTGFITIKGKPKQRIHDYEPLDFSVDYIDLRKEKNKEIIIKRLKEKEAKTPFNLDKGHLLRTRLLHIEEDRYLFLFTMHHIISDGWSIDIVTKEFTDMYDSYANGRANPLSPLPIQYKDYTQWHNRQLSGENLEKHRNYWLNRLSGEIPVLQLPTDYPRPKLRSFEGEYIYFSLSRETTEHLRRISRECGNTLFITFLAVANVFLYRYTGQMDIIVGTPVAGRDHKDLENQIGFYVNMLALRNKLNRGETFRDVLQVVKANTLGAFENQVYPFDRLVKDLNIVRDLSRNPLFDVVVTAQTGNNTSGDNETYTDEFLEIGFGASKHDLRFRLIETGSQANIHIQYNPKLFRKERIMLMKEQLIILITDITSNIDKEIDNYNFLTEFEQKQTTVKFQGGF
ncbi:MAG: AMP-binding protein, partial [Candidatus Aminicenantes bacterium]